MSRAQEKRTLCAKVREPALMPRRRPALPKKLQACACGQPGVYKTDNFGVISEHHRCRDCYERAVAQCIREDTAIRDGQAGRETMR